MSPLEKKKSNFLEKIHEDPDFILSKRFDNSIEKMIERYPTGAPDRIIAKSLLLDEKQLEEIFYGIVVKLRKMMGVEIE